MVLTAKFMSNETNIELQTLCKTIGEHLAILHKGDTVSALWPFIITELEFYAGEEFIKKLFYAITELKNKGHSIEEIAQLFSNPSKIAQYFCLFHSAKCLKLDERKQLALDLIDCIHYYRKDPFCTNKSNVLNEKIVNKAILNAQLSVNSNEISTANKISALTLMYLEIVYPTIMRLGHEFHGPYKQENNFITIKEFYDLKSEFMPLSKEFPFKNIIIVEKTEEPTQLDFFNHLIYMPKRSASAIFIDSKQATQKEAEEALQKIEWALTLISSMHANCTKKEWLKSASNNLFYSIKKLSDKLNCDWKPAHSLMDKIENQEFNINLDKIIKFQNTHSQQELQNITTESFLSIFRD